MEKVKLVTFSTPSHREMAERFVLSNAHDAGFDDVLAYHSQHQYCKSARFNTEGFDLACIQKVATLANLPIGGKYLYVDADCLIRPGLAEWCDQYLTGIGSTISFGDDVAEFCMGVVLWQQTEQSAKLFSCIEMVAFMLGGNDQAALHALLAQAKRVPVNMRKLPSSIISNWPVMNDASNKHWQGEPFKVLISCLCWHANFCIGVERKIEMLERAKKNLDTVPVNCNI